MAEEPRRGEPHAHSPRQVHRHRHPLDSSTDPPPIGHHPKVTVDSTYWKAASLPTRAHLTDVEQILLGLIASGLSSGYELKRFFATTPAVAYEPSSGTIYPALRRLERDGLLDGELVGSQGRRRQRRYRLTAAGRAAHLEWLGRPVDPRTVARDLGTHLMRFAMAEGLLEPSEVLALLSGLAAALEAFVEKTEHYLESASLPGRHARLALRHGIEVHRASLAWARGAIEVLSAPGGAATGAAG
ncbi:MAG TPA: PadR family transcriptional regulator [Acidimicrobiales bacterium]|nr:PadR family transcriptional regulator [Acidimicrobiales bacterium]